MENFTITNNNIDFDTIKLDLLEIINNQKNLLKVNNSFDSLILWISNTNGYVSCHLYDSDNEIINEDFYSILELPELHEKYCEIEDLSFCDIIENYLKKLNSFSSIKELKLFYTWEINEPEQLIL